MTHAVLWCLNFLLIWNFAQSKNLSLSVKLEWKRLEFDYESDARRQDDIAKGIYLPDAAIPIDVDVYYGKNSGNSRRIFVTAPRLVPGVPASLGEVLTNETRNGNPLIRPFPSWSWHRNSRRCNRNRLISVFRVKIDQCGRMWVLDGGRIGNDQICPPQIIAFDVETKAVLNRYEFSSDLYEPRSAFITPAVDIRNNDCSNTFVYAVDCRAFALIVYNVSEGRAWKVSHRSMFPNPEFGRYTIEGESFDLMDGLFGLDVGPLHNGDRKLFYHAMSANTESWVYTSFIRNESNFAQNPEAQPEMYHTFKTVRPAQSAAMGIDKSGVAYFGLQPSTSINCWNTGSNEYGLYIDAVSRNRVTLQFPSGLKVVQNPNGKEELWVLSCRFQKFMTGSLNFNETNFRISTNRIENLLPYTNCTRPNRRGSNFGGFVDSYCEKGYNMRDV